MTKIAIITAALLLGASAAQAKNMFYILDAAWCENGVKQFRITDDGSLIYDEVKGRVCQIKSATNMDQAQGDYVVTWRCERGEVKEKLSTSIVHDKSGNRRFFLTRRTGGKIKTYEQCEEGKQ